jgi:hypothetical protein
MNYSLNVCLPISEGDIINYLNITGVSPEEPTDEVGLDNEAADFSMRFIKDYLVLDTKIDEEATADDKAFKDLVLRMENYIFLKRHALWLYEKIEDNQ